MPTKPSSAAARGIPASKLAKGLFPLVLAGASPIAARWKREHA